MYHLVLDLEMCKVPKNYRSKNYKYAMETIQIGAVLLDEHFNTIGTLNQYVHPEHGVIDHFIGHLTGITNAQIKEAPVIREALLHMIDWIGERDYQIYAWSNSDYLQITHEMKAKQIEDEAIVTFMDQERWVDYQDVFARRYDFARAVALEEALTRAEIEPEGRLHDGMDDALNTARLIRVLEQNPDFELQSYTAPVQESEACSFSLGDLFAKLNLQIA